MACDGLEISSAYISHKPAPHTGKVRLDVMTAVIPRMAKIATHSAEMDLMRFFAAFGLFLCNPGMNLSLFAAASARSNETTVNFRISA